MARPIHALRSIPAILPVLALAGSLHAQDRISGPGEFPRCPDPNSIAIAYKDGVTDGAALLRPESLLRGQTELWPVARPLPACDAGVAPVRVAFSVNYTPLQPQPGSGLFTVDMGPSLKGELVALELALPDGSRIVRRVWTLDASIATSTRRYVGARVEESDEVHAGPPDRVTLNLFAKDKEDRYISDLHQEELSVEVETIPLPAGAIQKLLPPSSEIPLRILIAIDVSTFLEQGGAQARFSYRYREFVDDVVMAGLESFSWYLSRLEPPVPAVEIGLVRYARSGQWLEDPFWRADAGLSDSQREKFHDFLMAPPNPSWLADGYSDADTTLHAMRRLWHYFDGRRALIVLPRGEETFTARANAPFLPPQLEHGPPSIEEAAAQIRDGDPGPVDRILQHTDRRYPTVYAILPATTVPEGERGRDWIRRLVDATGGVTTWSDDDLPEQFDKLLRLAYDDLRNAQVMIVEIPNDAQKSRWKKLRVRAGNNVANLRAPNFYESSGSICRYLASYLLTEDPVTRLVAANEAARCVGDPGLASLLQQRLYGASERETEPLVRDEMLRSTVELMFRRLQRAIGKDRKAAHKDLLALITKCDADKELKARYTGIANDLIAR